MSKCIQCGRELTADEIGLHRKMVNRAATEYLCIHCLAAYYGVSKQGLEEKIRQFKEMGCGLFGK